MAQRKSCASSANAVWDRFFALPFCAAQNENRIGAIRNAVSWRKSAGKIKNAQIGDWAGETGGGSVDAPNGMIAEIVRKVSAS